MSDLSLRVKKNFAITLNGAHVSDGAFANKLGLAACDEVTQERYPAA